MRVFVKCEVPCRSPMSTIACSLDAYQATPVLLLLLYGVAIALVSQLMYSSQVLFPKIDWIDRMVIAFKQHKTARRPASDWSPLTWSFFLCWGGFHLSRGSSASTKNVTFVLICRRVSIGGFLDPVLLVEISRLHSILQINTGLYWLASCGGDYAYLENVG